MPVPAENTPLFVSLNPEHQRMFEELKEQDQRNNSDMIRYLIVKEYNMRQAAPKPVELPETHRTIVY